MKDTSDKFVLLATTSYRFSNSWTFQDTVGHLGRTRCVIGARGKNVGSVRSFTDREPGATHQATRRVEGHPAQRMAALHTHPTAGTFAIGAFLQ
jgi:hypothetical protein